MLQIAERVLGGILISSVSGNSQIPMAVNGSQLEHLVRELALISERLDPNTQSEWILRRLQFLAFEFDAWLRSSSIDRTQAKLTDLNRFFFEVKNFRLLLDSEFSHDPAMLYLMGRVLVTRQGSAHVLALLYNYLANHVSIALDFADLQFSCFLKFRVDGAARFVDLYRLGRVLDSAEVIEYLQRRMHAKDASASELLEVISFERYMTDFLRTFRIAFLKRESLEGLLFIQERLLHYQPSNLQYIGERAILHRRLGNFKSSLADLKRYFSFRERATAPTELVQLHDELTAFFSEKVPGTFSGSHRSIDE